MKTRRCLLSLVCQVSVLLVAAVLPAEAAEGDEYWDTEFGTPRSEPGYVGGFAFDGEMIYVTGTITQIGGVSARAVAKWDGLEWTAANGPGWTAGPVAVFGGSAYVGGNEGSDAARLGIARWDGQNWLPVGGGLNGPATAMVVKGSNLYVCGQFNVAGGIAANGVARWDGRRWWPLGSGIVPPPPGGGVAATRLDALAVSGQDVYVGGTFLRAGDLAVTNIAHWDGTNWHALGKGLRMSDNPGNAENGRVVALAMYQGRLYAGGEFWFAGEVATRNLARWDGTYWSAVGGPGAYYGVTGLATDGESLYAAGPFDRIGDVVCTNIARWDGHTWSPLGSGLLGFSPGGLACDGSQVYVGGDFRFAGGKPAYGLARWHIPRKLKAVRSADRLAVSWPAPDTNFVLETSERLTGGEWLPVSGVPVVVNARLTVTNQTTGPARFYRLRQR